MNDTIPYRKLLFVVLGLTFAVYAGILGQGYVNYDDNWYIVTNPLVAELSWDKLPDLFLKPHHTQYSPLAQLYLGVLFQLGGGEPFLMKLFALLTHLLNVALVFVLIQKLTSDDRAAFFVSTLFAIHPLQVESVAWLTAIFKISACFSLVAMWLYIRFLETRRIAYYAGVVVLFLLSLLTKEQAVLLPISLVLIDYVRGRSLTSREVLVEKLPLFLVSFFYGLATIKIATTTTLATVVPVDQDTLLERIYLIALALTHYVQKLLAPTGLSMLYARPDLPGAFEVKYVVVPLLATVCFALVVLALRRSRMGLFGFMFWLVNLSLALALALSPLRESIVADRYLYLASAGFFLVVYTLLAQLVEFHKGAVRPLRVAVVACVLILSWLSFQRTSVFAGGETLWADAVRQNPDNHLAIAYLGEQQLRNGEFDKAIGTLQASVRADSTSYFAHFTLGLAFYEAGRLQPALKHTSEAIELYESAFESPEREVRYVNARINRASIYRDMRRFDMALADNDAVLVWSPGDTDALYNRALVYYDTKRYRRCLADLLELLGAQPDHKDALNLAGLTYSRLQDPRNALLMFDRAIALAPRDGALRLNRSWAHYQLEDRQSAIADALEARRLGTKVDPAYVDRLRR